MIRSFHKQSMFRRMNEVTLDDNLSTYNTLKSVDRWLSFRLEVLGNFIVLFASGLAILSSSKAGSTGLSLNNALGITGLLNWAVRNAAEAESYMNSVERVYHTIEQTPQERSRVVDSYDPSTFVYGEGHFSSTSSNILSDSPKDGSKDGSNGVSEDIVTIGDNRMTPHHINHEESTDAVVEVDATGIDTHYNIDMSSSAVNPCIEDSLLSNTFDTVEMMKSYDDVSISPHLNDDISHSVSTTAASTSSSTTTTSASHLLPQNDADLIHSGWPYSGGIVLEGVTLRYRPDFGLVLKGIDAAIAPGERIGIVGE